MNNRYGNGIEYRPSCYEGNVSCGHSLGKLCGPTGMSVTCSLEYGSSAESCAVEVTFGNCFIFMSIDVNNSISESVVVDLIYVFGKCGGHLIVYRESVSEAALC